MAGVSRGNPPLRIDSGPEEPLLWQPHTDASRTLLSPMPPHRLLRTESRRGQLLPQLLSQLAGGSDRDRIANTSAKIVSASIGGPGRALLWPSEAGRIPASHPE